MFVLKLNYNGDTRRVTFSKETLPDYIQLEKHIREVCNDSVLNGHAFVLKYVDDEGDAISVSCDHDLREAFLFCDGTGRSSLRADVHPLDKKYSPPSEPAVHEASDIKEGLLKSKEEWAARVVNFRGKIKGIVDVVQKFGTMLQKKLEEKQIEESPESATEVKEEHEAKEEECKQNEMEMEKEKDEKEEKEKEEEREEKEKEKEKEAEPKVVVSLEVSQDVIAPLPTKVSNEWREMLKLYEVTVEELEEINAQMKLHLA